MAKNNRHNNDPTGLNLPPVAADQIGQGLPYAPINFPEQGDVWGWKTGKRLQPNGCFQDRYLYLPERLSSGSDSKDQHTFRSKLSVERYIRSTFPDANVDAFFASFTWRIPAVAEGLPYHGTGPTKVTMTGSTSQVILREEYHSQILNLEAEIDDILAGLRKSQELEYKVAEERLHAQKIYIQNLYEQLQCVVTELECPDLTHSGPLFRAIREKKEQIKQEKEKFNEMKMVASGFGRISRDILKEHFAYE
ncbi:calmodulin protein kinase [Trifolium pratense]|uniref:Calmodulin protein kinase n=1 Tax=Trifolium pratense TaxID=57577 RepID=A0A2K3PAR1_TRIPR|nr:calmodulin protein kinase [Trifolium pratense]PNY08262.1 calmodulin protein kinase [Trifolium pratense]PNY12367.1 calmodulin protein kinase [Trifolium pratense]